jgi:hypothetical protein
MNILVCGITVFNAYGFGGYGDKIALHFALKQPGSQDYGTDDCAKK